MRMFGFRILENFNYPYIARSIREFWRRWHISLSNWFRDYLYIPLGRQPARRAPRLREPRHRVPAVRAVARRELAVRAVGRMARRCSWSPSAPDSIGVLRSDSGAPRPRLRAAGGDGRLGAVPLRHARARGRLLPRARRTSRSGDPVAPSARRNSWIRWCCVTLVRRRRVRDAARAAHRRSGATGVAATPGPAAAGVLAADVAWLAASAVRRQRVPRRRHLQSVHLLPLLMPVTRRFPVAASGAAAGAGDASAARPRRRRAVRAGARRAARARSRSRGRERRRCSRTGRWRRGRRSRCRATFPAGVRARVRRPLRRPRRADAPPSRGAAANCSASRRCPTVMRGSDGWFYWLGEDGHSLDRHYRGIAAVSAERRRRHRRANSSRRRDWLAARGIAYVVVGRAREIHDLSGVSARVGRRVAAAVAVRPRRRRAASATAASRSSTCAPPLREAKARERVYYQTDSHWNYTAPSSATRRSCARCSARCRRAACRRSRRAAARRTCRASISTAATWSACWACRGRIREDDVAPLGKVLARQREPLRAARRQGRDSRLRNLRLRPPGAAARGRLSRLDGDPADPAAVGELLRASST